MENKITKNLVLFFGGLCVGLLVSHTPIKKPMNEEKKAENRRKNVKTRDELLSILKDRQIKSGLYSTRIEEASSKNKKLNTDEDRAFAYNFLNDRLSYIHVMVCQPEDTKLYSSDIVERLKNNLDDLDNWIDRFTCEECSFWVALKVGEDKARKEKKQEEDKANEIDRLRNMDIDLQKYMKNMDYNKLKLVTDTFRTVYSHRNAWK